MAATDRIDELEIRLGHRFARRALIEQALTHASFFSGDDARSQSYQRLEFLGDRVLGLSVSTLLYQRFPEVPEGSLSRALADMVRKETCASVAEGLGVGACLRMGKGERKSGLARKTAVLGDACEAILGAIYLDAGFAVADELIRRHWAGKIPDVEAATADPKTRLQEWAHTQGLTEPRYKELERAGPDHAPIFRIAATVEGLKPSEGQGRSKRAAERDAAETMLRREGVIGANE